MSTPTKRPGDPQPDLDAVLGDMPLAHRTLPRWAPLGILGGCAVLVAVVLLALGGFGVVGLVVLSALIYPVVVYAVSRSVEGRRRAADRMVTVIVTTAFLLALAPLISVVVTVIGRGLARFDIELFTFSMSGVLGAGGGVYHAIIGTLVITLLATALSVPIGLLAAIYLVEYGRGKLAKALTFFVDVMTGIPSIVAGLFAYALFVLFLGPGVQFGFVAAVALTVLMIPVVVRSTEEMLKIVPNELREASYALGVPRWRTILKIVIPTALAGIATGVTLAIARVIGETAPLLVTAGITSSTNANPFDGAMAALSVFAYSEYKNPGVPPEPAIDRVWATVLVLILIVMLLNLIARLISRLFAPKIRS